MRLRPWHLLLVAAALLVPLQASAIGGGSGLNVSASLDYCGVNPGGVSCKIDASWSGVAQAESYTATVTLADGSVTDVGTVGAGSGGGSTSVWVPYAGNGFYTLTITAWGTDPEGKPKKVDEQDAGAKVDADQAKPEPTKPDDNGEQNADDDEQKPPPAEQPDQPSPPVAEPEPPAPPRSRSRSRPLSRSPLPKPPRHPPRRPREHRSRRPAPQPPPAPRQQPPARARPPPAERTAALPAAPVPTPSPR